MASFNVTVTSLDVCVLQPEVGGQGCGCDISFELSGDSAPSYSTPQDCANCLNINPDANVAITTDLPSNRLVEQFGNFKITATVHSETATTAKDLQITAVIKG